MDILKPEANATPHGFSLTRYGTNTKTFFASDHNEMEKWCQKIRRYCVQTDFSAFYDIQEQIGKGNFAKVYKAKSKKDDKHYAVKVIQVEGCLKSSKVRVSIFLLKKI